MSQIENTALYRKYVAMLHSSAMRVLREKQQAEDVVQEAFAQYLRCCARGNTIEHPGAYLYRIAMRLAVKSLQQNYGFIEVRIHHGSDLGFDTEAHIDVNKILSLANEEEASIALMYYVEGLNQDEIAQILGMSQRTISYRIQSFCSRAAKIFDRPGIRNGAVYDIEIDAPNQAIGDKA